jgi:hypothetical protein
VSSGDEDPAPPNGEDPGSGAVKKPFLLRLPEPLLADLRVWANQELRSLNGHIEYLLRAAVDRRKSGGDRGP